MRIKPKGRIVLVKPKEVKDTYGSLAIPQSVIDREKLAVVRGIVVAVGSLCWDDSDSPPYCAPGDEIIFAKYAGLVVEEDEKYYRLINDIDVLAVVENGE